MKKLSKNFKLTSNCIYKHGRRQYTEIPRGKVLMHYVYDEEHQIYVGVLKRKKHFLQILLTLILITDVYLFTQAGYNQHIVKLSDTVNLSNDVLGLNIVNDSSNVNDVTIELLKEDKSILAPITLQPGESVGNVNVETELETGSYLCTILYMIDGKYIDYKKKFDLLVVVN